MTGGLTPAAQSALTASPYNYARFVEIDLPTGPFRVWTGIGPRTLFSNVYTGVASLGSIAPISDSSDLSATRLQLSLSGLNPSLLAEVSDILHQGSPVTIIETQLDANGQIIPDPYSIFDGEVDIMSSSLGASLTISVQVDNFLSFIFRGPDGHRRTAVDQQTLYPNSGSPDMGLQFCANLLADIPWGVNSKITQRTGGTSAGSGAAVAQSITN